jgi:hypothetical protein
MIRIYSLLTLCIYFSCLGCGNESSVSEHFELVIAADSRDQIPALKYTLTDSVLTITELDNALQTDVKILETIAIAGADSVQLIAWLDVKARDCREQHALQEYTIRFSHNDTAVHVDPNVNHPKELDIAVRLINRHVSPKYQLHFTDMQGAIEPDGKMEL